MGHQHDSKREPKEVKVLKTAEVQTNSDATGISTSNPFFDKNDLTLLTMINPLLSSNAQRVLSFFINYGNAEPSVPGLGNIGDLLQQLPSTQRNSIMEMAPSILNMLSNPDGKNGGGSLNPALLSTLLTTLMNPNKKED